MECGLCRRAAPPFTKAVAYGSYDRELRGLIHLLKYEGVMPARKTLGRLLAGAILPLIEKMGPEVALVPVPLHAGKRRQRGFNQAELVAAEAVKYMGDGRFRLETGALARRRNTQSQIGLTRHQRRENLRGAFAVISREPIKNREVLLVDDVFTTGTTVSECSKVLLRAGASKIWVATIARTLKAEVQLGDLTAKQPVQALRVAV